MIQSPQMEMGGVVWTQINRVHMKAPFKKNTFLYWFLQQNYVEMTVQTSQKKHSSKKNNHVITFNYVITKLKIKVATGKIGLYY